MGMNIGAKNYDDPAYQRQLARLDVVILGFYQGWKPGYGMAQVVRNLKELSGGKILVGQYTILNECGDDPKDSATLDIRTKLNDMDWWARKADGRRVQWTAQYRSWDINFTAGSKPDANGQRFPQWLAERDDRVFFKPVPFDLWYCDNAFFRPRVTADWNHAGADGDPKSPGCRGRVSRWPPRRVGPNPAHSPGSSADGQRRRRSVGAGICRPARGRVPGRADGQELVHRELGLVGPK